MLNETESFIREYIHHEFMPGTPADALSNETPLLRSGILDSISVLRLVAHLEATYNVEFEPYELDSDNLETTQAIAALAVSKRSKPSD